MKPFNERVEDLLEEKLAWCKDHIDRLYWLFTRSARGVPPCLADPALHAYQKRVRVALNKWRKRMRRA